MSKESNGRELDVAVAEHVMGLRPTWSAVIYGDWMDNSHERPDRIKRYSTDIAAAMEVVEKMFADGFAVLMRRANKWYVEFTPRTINATQNIGRVIAGSLTEAICKAALLAVAEKEVAK